MVIPNYFPITPWFATPEVALIQGTLMNTTWVALSVLGSFIILILSFWITSKTKFGDFIWPIVTFFIASIVLMPLQIFSVFGKLLNKNCRSVKSCPNRHKGFT